MIWQESRNDREEAAIDLCYNALVQRGNVTALANAKNPPSNMVLPVPGLGRDQRGDIINQAGVVRFQPCQDVAGVGPKPVPSVQDVR